MKCVAVHGGSICLFPRREDAEAFVKDDPFIVDGIVRAWRMLEWNEVAMPRPPEC